MIVAAVTNSSKTSPRSQIPDLCAEQEELRPRAGCQVPGQPDRVVDPEQDGWGRGQSHLFRHWGSVGKVSEIELTRRFFRGQKSKIAETLDDAEAEDIPYPDEKKMTVSIRCGYTLDVIV